jgi:hypothetical protein
VVTGAGMSNEEITLINPGLVEKITQVDGRRILQSSSSTFWRPRILYGVWLWLRLHQSYSRQWVRASINISTPVQILETK